MTRFTDANFSSDDFERLTWHDNLVYALRIDRGDPERDQWHSDLALDIDYIAEWPVERENPQFLVAPATLTFHSVTDLSIVVDHGDSNMRTVLNEWSIHAIHRAPVPGDPSDGYPPRRYYAWRIELNSPAGGELNFGASGFTQVLRAAPIRVGREMRLPTDARPPM